MRRSKNQIIYSALPGQFITFSSSKSDRENCKRANQCVINIKKWNTKRISEDEIYFPKIVGQIKMDLKNFIKSADKDYIDMDKNFKNFFGNSKENYKFLEINNEKVNDFVKNDENLTNQIFGYINPKLFYCPKCGRVKNLKYDTDIYEMNCDVCKKQMKQYNRIWACSCGNFLPIKILDEKISNYRYFPKNKNEFIINGKESGLKAPICSDCGNSMKMINATDNASFYPRIIKSVNLIKNEDAKICSSKEGIELILKRKIGDINENEFIERKNNILNKKLNAKKAESSITGLEALLKNIKSGDKEETFRLQEDDESIAKNEAIAYKLLEYETIKNNTLLTLDKAMENSVKYEQAREKTELEKLLKIMGIKDISSITNIEIINTAYGYTRVYPSEENVLQNEKFIIRSFIDSSSKEKYENGTIDFLNTRDKTEGILIELDKEKIIKFLQSNNEIMKNRIIQTDNEKELNKWFIENPDPTIIDRYSEIQEDGSCTKDVYTLLHTISHMFINVFGENCGLDKNSLGEMIFINVPAIFIYSQTIQGYVLGALTDMFKRNLLNVLKETFENSKVCIFDPICMDTSNGRCVGCSYLDEVTCEHFNQDLTRKFLYGYRNNDTEKNIIGFWEK